MVHIIVENILSTSANRVLFETLWNLAITKNYKFGNVKNRKAYENESIADICNELIEEIKRDDPDRANFYFSTQIVFGTLLLFRYQIDKLYNQAKYALQSCNVKIFEINWLTQQSNHNATKNGNKRGSKKIKKQIHSSEHLPTDLQTEIDLLEQFFDQPVSKNKSGIDEETDPTLDPTMAINVNEITLIDNRNRPSDVTDIEENIDFGEGDMNSDVGFCPPQQKHAENTPAQNHFVGQNETDQEVPYIMQSPDILRKAASPNPLEMSLAHEIMEVINNEKPKRKQRKHQSSDISLRLESLSKKPRLDDEENLNENVSVPNDMIAIQQPEIPPFDSDANVAENSPIAVIQTPEVPKATVPNDLDFIDFALMDPISTLDQQSTKTSSGKKIKKNSKLIIDKKIKIKDEIIKHNQENYQKKFTVESPMHTFDTYMHQLKSSKEFFDSPASRLKRCARQLLPIYERNLKKVPMKLYKRPRDDPEEPPQSPPKKRRTDQSILEVPDIEVMQHLPENEVPIQIAEDAGQTIEPILPYQQPMERTTNCNLFAADFEAQPIETSEKFVDIENRPTRNIGEYQEGEKWSKEMVMNKLKTFWNKNDDSITMGKLSSKTSRFVAAGIFFELMVLSKVGAIELKQDNDLAITNITPGHCVNLFI